MCTGAEKQWRRKLQGFWATGLKTGSGSEYSVPDPLEPCDQQPCVLAKQTPNTVATWAMHLEYSVPVRIWAARVSQPRHASEG